MEFTNKPVDWQVEGVEPSQELKETGFVGGYKPPAATFNYFFHNTGKAIAETQQAASSIDSNLKVHTNNTANPHGVTAAQVGAAAIDLSNVSNEDFIAKASESGASGVNYVYQCTGNADNVAISNLVNSFLNATGDFAGTTALTMKVVVSGDVGVSETPAFGTGVDEDNIARYFNFMSNQSRGARVQIDWSDARIPEINSSLDYVAGVYHGGSGSTIYHDGLAIKIVSDNHIYAIYNKLTDSVYLRNCYCYARAEEHSSDSIPDGFAYSYGIFNSAGTIYITNSNCQGCGRKYGNGNGYGVYNAFGSITYINNSYCLGAGSTQDDFGDGNGVFNDNGNAYIDNCYCLGADTGSGCKGYGIYNNTSSAITYVSNSYCIAYTNGQSSYGIYNVKGTTYISNSYCFAHHNYDSWGAVYNGNGTVYLSNCYCGVAQNSGNNQTCDGICNKLKGTIYISNTFCNGNGNPNSSGVYNSSFGTIYINNSYCYGNHTGIENNRDYDGETAITGNIYISNSYCCGGQYAVVNNDFATIYINNSWCYVNSDANSSYAIYNEIGIVYICNTYCYSNSSYSDAYGVYNSSTGMIHITNSLCVGASTNANVSTGYNGYGLWMDNTQTTGYGKLIAQNCCFRGYCHTSNTSGVGYGVGSATANNGQYNVVVLTGCYFDRVTITDLTQTGAVKLGASSTITPKYHILGNIFYDTTVSIGGSNIASTGVGVGKYIPTNGNIWGITE